MSDSAGAGWAGARSASTLGFDDLAAAVETVSRDMMAAMYLATLAFNGQSGGAQRIVGTTHITP